MVAPLVVAGARLAGSQLAKKGAIRAAGAQLARKETMQTAAGQLAKKVPQAAGKQVTNTLKAPVKTNGPVYGYSNPKLSMNEIDAIKDWQGKNNKQNKVELAGEKLQPKNNNSETVDKNTNQESEYTDDFEDEDAYIPTEEFNENNLPANRPMAEKRPRLGGVDYFGVLMVVVAKDILDVFLEIINFVLDALVVTSPIGIFLEVIDAVADFIVLIVTQGYLLLNDVPVTGKKLGIQGLSTLIELVPFLGILPVGTISFLYLVKKVNKERKEQEDAEQAELDKQFIEEQNSIINQTREQNVHRSRVQRIESEPEKMSEKPKNNDWKEMVDTSNQNITRPSNTNNPVLKQA